MATPPGATLYYNDLKWLSRQSAARILRLWRRVDLNDISRSWLQLLPDAVAVVAAAQAVAAELADPYLTDVLEDQGPARARTVNPEAFAGATPTSESLASLLYLPVIDAKEAIATGTSPAGAMRFAEFAIVTYARTTTTDAGRLSVTAGMAARPHATGYYRMLRPPSCARCAILAGKHFKVNEGFRRHPRCDCVHIPVREADDDIRLDTVRSIERGQVTGLSKADRRSILEFGANPSQVVNAKKGMYTAAGAKFTTTGTTRQGVAGARLLAKDVARSHGGIAAAQGTFRNFTFSRERAAQYAELLRKGTTYGRVTRTGRPQTYAYRLARSRRLTPEQILRDARSREDAVRLLINNGYIL